MESCTCWMDVVMSALIAVLVTLLTYVVIYSMKPRLRIAEADLGPGGLLIPITNLGRYNAVNVRIEVCAYDETQKHSYHFTLDHADFMIIPSAGSKDNEKKFKTIDAAESAKHYGKTHECLIESIRTGEYNLRVRVHAYHAFSGFGKAQERIFDRLG